MKSSFAATLAFGAAVYAQSLADIPSCALTCLSSVLGSDGCSSLTDYACHCKNTDLIPQAQPCVETDCPSAASQSAVASALEGICSSAGVPITITVGAASSAAATSAAATSAAATSAAASSSAAATSAAASSAVVASSSSAAVVASSSVAAASSSVAATTTAVGTGSASTSSNGTVVTTPSPTAFEGAGSHVTGAAGLVGLALAAIAAL